MGVARERIMPLGIPVRRQFSSAASRQQARAGLGLAGDKFTILMMRGGLGVGPVEEVLVRLRVLPFDLQAIVVCGHNTILRKRMDAVDLGPGKGIKVIGFSHNVAMLMAASDIMIGKAGGITVAEALSMGLPIICFNPIPGQEWGNTSFLADNNLGFKVKGLDEINAIIEDMWRNPFSRGELERRIRQAGRPGAAGDTVRLALRMLKI
jgi:processive 1,2-diacylglycerol beta-glucosyltransferase